jgi:hypothetical protein
MIERSKETKDDRKERESEIGWKKTPTNCPTEFETKVREREGEREE